MQAEWLKEIKENVTYPSQDDLQITEEKVEMQCKKMLNWKAPGLDGVQSFWIKYLTSCHQRIADQSIIVVGGTSTVFSSHNFHTLFPV